MDGLWRTLVLTYVDNGQDYTVSRRGSNQGSYAKPLLVFVIPMQTLSSHRVSRWSDCIGYRIEIHSMPNWFTYFQPSYNTAHTQWNPVTQSHYCLPMTLWDCNFFLPLLFAGQNRLCCFAFSYKSKSLSPDSEYIYFFFHPCISDRWA